MVDTSITYLLIRAKNLILRERGHVNAVIGEKGSKY